MKRLLIIFLLMSSVTSAADFNITWTPVKEDIVNKEYIITIQNLDTDMRTVDVESFFEDTNFDTSKIRDVEFFEQIVNPVKKEIKHYKTIQVPEIVSHIDNKTGMLINTTKMVNKSVLDYIEKKTIDKQILKKQESKVLKKSKTQKEVSHGKITLPSIKTVGKINNAGTKTFILKFKTPPDGSYGKVGLKINGKEYHPYWNSTWSNRKKIIFTGNTSEPLLDRQLLLNITYESEMNSDFSDIRFCNETDQLSAWLESKVNESYAHIWIRFPYLPHNEETKDYWMYYGNSEASAYWDGNATFEFFDNFEIGSCIGQATGWINEGGITLTKQSSVVKNGACAANSVITTAWRDSYKSVGSQTQDRVFEYYARVPQTNIHKAVALDNVAGGHINCVYIVFNLDGYISYYDTAYHQLQAYNADTWYKFKITTHPVNNTFDIDIDNVNQGTGLTARGDYTEGVNYIDVCGNTGGNQYVDMFFIHKYTSPEPIYTFSGAEYYVDSIYFNFSNPYYNLIDYKGDIAVNHSYYPSDDLEWTASALNNDTGLVVTSMGSSEIDFITYEGILDWLQLVNLDNSKIYTLQNSSGDIEEHQASGNAVNFTTDLSPDNYEIEITAVPTPSPTATPTGVQPANYSGTKLSDADIKSFYYPFMYILFIVIIIGGFMHVFGN